MKIHCHVVSGLRGGFCFILSLTFCKMKLVFMGSQPSFPKFEGIHVVGILSWEGVQVCGA